MSRPRRAALMIASLASFAIVLTAAIAVWRHLGDGHGDDLATRGAITTSVDAAVANAIAHSSLCSDRLKALASAQDDASASAFDAALAELARCGSTARHLAEQGYSALDAAAGNVELASTPGRDAYLDAAGALLSIYEMQGDDFDMLYDMLDGALSGGAPMAPLRSDITSVLGNGAPDIQNGQKELGRARDSYRAKG